VRGSGALASRANLAHGATARGGSAPQEFRLALTCCPTHPLHTFAVRSYGPIRTSPPARSRDIGLDLARSEDAGHAAEHRDFKGASQVRSQRASTPHACRGARPGGRSLCRSAAGARRTSPGPRPCAAALARSAAAAVTAADAGTGVTIDVAAATALAAQLKPGEVAAAARAGFPVRFDTLEAEVWRGEGGGGASVLQGTGWAPASGAPAPLHPSPRRAPLPRSRPSPPLTPAHVPGAVPPAGLWRRVRRAAARRRRPRRARDNAVWRAGAAPGCAGAAAAARGAWRRRRRRLSPDLATGGTPRA
jgi:hypothetical protein